MKNKTICISEPADAEVIKRCPELCFIIPKNDNVIGLICESEGYITNIILKTEGKKNECRT